MEILNTKQTKNKFNFSWKFETGLYICCLIETKMEEGNKILNAKEKPTVFNGVHESVYQSYQVLMLVIEMMARGDSNETIMQIIGAIRSDKTA